jgi:hypothetical protein
MILLGLSRKNIEELTAGNDVVFDATELGFKGKMQITFGETEGAIAQRLRLPAFEPRSGIEYTWDPVTGMKVRKSPPEHKE